MPSMVLHVYVCLQPPPPPTLMLKKPPKGHEEKPGTSEGTKINKDAFTDKIVSVLLLTVTHPFQIIGQICDHCT